MSELNQRYLQLAAIVEQQNWRSDEVLLRAFTIWAHSQFGLAWQSVIFSAEFMPRKITGSITRSRLFFNKGVLSSVEIETEHEKHHLPAARIRPPVMARILFLAPEVNVLGIDEAELEQALKLHISSQQINTDTLLHKKLMSDFVVTKRGRSRTSRLIRKLFKDPVLFFRDSRSVFGRSVYSFLRLVVKEKAL